MIHYPHLFNTGKLGAFTTKNRIVMSPMDENMANADGSVSEQSIAYYGERAKGGAGVIITGAVSVDYPRSKTISCQHRLDNIKFVKGWERMARAVHRYDALFLPQIHHTGAHTDINLTEGLTPFKVSDDGPETYETLSHEGIKMLEQKYIAAAKYAQMAGCDGVEVHGYLLMQFLTKTINHRTDEYGGSLENRSRFVVNIIKGIRQECGHNFIIGIKTPVHNLDTDTLTDKESLELAEKYEASGCDYLHAVGGITPKLTDLVESQSYEQGCRVKLAEKLKKAVNIPVFAAGLLREPDFCEKVLAENRADFIVLGRALIADPYWPEKAKNGRKYEIRRCITCLDACYGNIYYGRPIRCVLNPAVGSENELRYEPPAKKSKKVVVVGGGLAGMQAAITATERGHKAIILEETDRLGGQINLACIPPHKEYLKWALDWFIGEVKRAKIEVHFNTEANLGTIKALNTDVVVIATGSKPWLPRIDGIENGIQSWDILSGNIKRPINKRISIIGGGSIGCETGLYLAEAGNHVTILEMLGDFAAGLELNNKIELSEEMKSHDINLILNVAVQKIETESVQYLTMDGRHQMLNTDMVILSIGQRSRGQELKKQLEDEGFDVRVIGDAIRPSKIVNATTTGFYTALNLS
jgi:2,4-dienoyl-CoA reductase-like NADH-dependent reductase (Old Yellow Enzyme family)/thioredoxin reductase